MAMMSSLALVGCNDADGSTSSGSASNGDFSLVKMAMEGKLVTIQDEAAFYRNLMKKREYRNQPDVHNEVPNTEIKFSYREDLPVEEYEAYLRTWVAKVDSLVNEYRQNPPADLKAFLDGALPARQAAMARSKSKFDYDSHVYNVYKSYSDEQFADKYRLSRAARVATLKHAVVYPVNSKDEAHKEYRDLEKGQYIACPKVTRSTVSRVWVCSDAEETEILVVSESNVFLTQGDYGMKAPNTKLRVGGNDLLLSRKLKTESSKEAG